MADVFVHILKSISLKTRSEHLNVMMLLVGNPKIQFYILLT